MQPCSSVDPIQLLSAWKMDVKKKNDDDDNVDNNNINVTFSEMENS